jgi:hypothetical protein
MSYNPSYLIILVEIRMIFLGKNEVLFFNFRECGLSIDTQQEIWIIRHFHIESYRPIAHIFRCGFKELPPSKDHIHFIFYIHA